MSKIKQQFKTWQANTPKRVQWLLVAVAGVVILILLTLIFMRKEEKVIEEREAIPAELKFNPGDSINWPDVLVGETKEQTIKISANVPVKIAKVNLTQDIKGLTVKQTCSSIAEISTETACTVRLIYTPTAQMTPVVVPLMLDWYPIGDSPDMNKIAKITVVLGAQMPEVQQPAPMPVKPVVDTQQEEYNTPMYDDEEIEDKEEVPVKKTPAIAQENPFDEYEQDEEDIPQIPSEACSDFAMPGYGTSGRQTGWIKPVDGAYYFYPFSDTECKNPTGVYNPDNGIITDIKSKGKKIGTDAEHVGFVGMLGGAIPKLSNPVKSAGVNRAKQLTTQELGTMASSSGGSGGMARMGQDGFKAMNGLIKEEIDKEIYLGSAGEDSRVLASKQYDRQFILRQYKPIPATIVSEIRADPEALRNNRLPVRATVDRNVYSDDGRNVIIPTGTLLLGYISGELPGPYTSIGRMDINWYQFILPNGVEFNFKKGTAPFSGDAQGRSGIPGYGSTDYMEQFFMPMLTAIVPAAVNLIAPVSDAFVNQIDLDNNTVVQSGTVRSSEMAKNEIITAWNQVAQKLIVDMMDNTTPPFSIAAGTRITVYSPVDLVASCGDKDSDKKCSLGYAPPSNRWDEWQHNAEPKQDGSWVGQVRSFNLAKYCVKDNNGRWDIQPNSETQIAKEGYYDYRSVLFYCQSLNYQAINNAKQDAVYQNQQQQFASQEYNTQSTAGVSGAQTGIVGNKTYNEQVLGLTYNEDGSIENPFEDKKEEVTETVEVVTCDGGIMPDANGCCPGETYTDMGDQGFNCCPDAGGDCFPPIVNK